MSVASGLRGMRATPGMARESYMLDMDNCYIAKKVSTVSLQFQ